MGGPYRAASRPSRKRATKTTRWAMLRRRRCARSGTDQPIATSVPGCSPTSRQMPAQAAGCAGVSSFVPAPSVDRAAVSVIIPCLDEEAAIGPCVEAALSHGVGEAIVVDGGSADLTVLRASEAGACVISEPRRGYGRALLSGIAALAPRANVVLFIDGDGSDRPEM